MFNCHAKYCDFLTVAKSLSYQARSLGFVLHSQTQPTQANLSFQIQSQGGTSVQCTVSRWHEAHDQTPITESILQAACGLMSVHGRATRERVP
jgi:hypothetical protein